MGTFSYFVSFDVLKTPLIFKAAKVYQKHQSGTTLKKIKFKPEVKIDFTEQYQIAQIMERNEPET
jgi:hypothetical protein